MRRSNWKKLITILIGVLITAMVIPPLYYDWIDFQTYYPSVMKDLTSSETIAYMQDEINGTYTARELLNWTNKHLTWFSGDFTRYSKPEEILHHGIGRCEEFAIVYVAACVASGYEARLVISRQFYLAFLGVRGFHIWAEVKLNGVWIQADPSPTPFWNDTSHYKNWQWGSKLTLRIYALEDGRIEDITARYRYDGSLRRIWDR